MTKTLIGAAALVLALSACSGATTPAEHSQADRNEGRTTSSSGLPAGRAAEGEKLANSKGKATGQSCIDCHGKEGNAPIDPSYPRLAGQYADYIAHSIQNYRDGQREHALMSGQAITLTDQQIADLAAYFSSRPGQLRDLHGAD